MKRMEQFVTDLSLSVYFACIAMLPWLMLLLLSSCAAVAVPKPVVAPPVPLRLQTCLSPKKTPAPPKPPRQPGQLADYTEKVIADLNYANSALIDCRKRLQERNALEQVEGPP